MARIMVVGMQLLFFLPDLDKHFDLLEKNPHFIDPQVIISAIAGFSRETITSRTANFTVLDWVLVAAAFSP